jgi:hypothetical protein
MVTLWRALPSSLAVLAPAVGIPAQTAPLNLHIDVRPMTSFQAGNVTRVSYVVANTPRSTDRLFEFAVRSPVPVWRLELPTPRASYLGATRVGEDEVASWGWLERMPYPGESSPILVYEAIGLPGIVTYRALRYFGVRPVRPADTSRESEELRFDKPGTDYTLGKTVGVVSLPIDVRPVALADRLRQLVDEACELRWVDSPSVCRSLRGAARPSARAVRAFHRELVAQRGKTVSEAAFALLAPNAEFLLSKM